VQDKLEALFRPITRYSRNLVRRPRLLVAAQNQRFAELGTRTEALLVAQNNAFAAQFDWARREVAALRRSLEDDAVVPWKRSRKNAVDNAAPVPREQAHENPAQAVAGPSNGTHRLRERPPPTREDDFIIMVDDV